ncbi:hypothetical protein C8J57DRAFT_725735 [Mycena rebaudengoi]|nr:hypothetical protein C8J57DRAFT_725735 [Mycena rebaudengoi]
MSQSAQSAQPTQSTDKRTVLGAGKGGKGGTGRVSGGRGGSGNATRVNPIHTPLFSFIDGGEGGEGGRSTHGQGGHGGNGNAPQVDSKLVELEKGQTPEVMSLHDFCEKYKLQAAEQKLEDDGYSSSTGLFQATEQDLLDAGLKVGHIREIAGALAKLRDA